MSKSMKMIKTWLALMGVKPTNRNARKSLHRWKRYERVVRAGIKRDNSIIRWYRLPYYNKED